jgi:outer membrane protein assembly factor BamB
MRQLQRWAMVAALLVLASCSKDKDIDKPAQLTPFSATLKVDHVWSASVADKGAKPLRLGLGLAAEGNRVYAAGHSGDVIALDVATGHSVWRTKTKAAISGGPGVGGDLIAVGSSGGEVIALNTADGKIRWRVRLNGEILAAPAITERVVAVRTVDGKLRGLSPKDGHELWAQEQPVPRLSLRGTSYPVIVGDLALCGFDNGKVIAVNMNDGTMQWESTIAPPHGRTELERLVDVDSAVRVSGQDVYAVGFQGRVAMLALDTGQIWWSHDASSYRGLGLDDDALFIATADGDVVALRRRTGAEIWRQKALAHRGLSAVVATDNAVVVADYQGNVHWLDKATGELAARAPSGKVRVSNAPLVVGNTVLIINDAGRISAFRTTPIGASMSGARKVPAEDKPATTGAAPETAAPAASEAPPVAAPEPPVPPPTPPQ